MKRIILTAALFLSVMSVFSQTEQKNGTIYIKHPYIDIVNNTTKFYLSKDIASNAKLFADTAKYWVSGLEKSIPIADAFKMWAEDFDYYDSIKVTTFGYPDYLHYVDKDSKVVQSWWTWTGKSKKTGELVKIEYVQFDEFRNDGKISFEYIFGDFSKLVKK